MITLLLSLVISTAEAQPCSDPIALEWDAADPADKVTNVILLAGKTKDTVTTKIGEVPAPSITFSRDRSLVMRDLNAQWGDVLYFGARHQNAGGESETSNVVSCTLVPPTPTPTPTATPIPTPKPPTTLRWVIHATVRAIRGE